MSLYRKILKNAWQTTWRHKYLWFFGLFAALLGNGGELEIIFRGYGGVQESPLSWLREISSTGIFSWQTIANIGVLLKSDPATILMLVFVLSLLALIGGFLVWLVIISQIAIINNSAQDIFNKQHSIKDGIARAVKSFWPVFSLNLLSKTIVYLLFVLISWPILSGLFAAKQLSYNIAYLLLFVLFIPLSIIISFIIKYSIAYVVVKGESLARSLKKGIAIFKANWMVSIEMAFLLFAINFLAGLSLLIVLMSLTVPFIFVIMAFVKVTAYINFWFLLMSAVFLFIAIFAFAGSVLSTFQISAWTNLFIELESKGGISKLSRIFEKK